MTARKSKNLEALESPINKLLLSQNETKDDIDYFQLELNKIQ